MKREKIKRYKLPTPIAVHIRVASSKPKLAVSCSYHSLAPV